MSAPHDAPRHDDAFLFLRDVRGAIALNFAIMSIIIFGSVGLAVDGSRVFLARFKLQNAIDTAALAIGTEFGEEEEMDALAERFVRQNFAFAGAEIACVQLIQPGDTSASDCVPGGTVSAEGLGEDELAIVARARVKNFFLSVSGYSDTGVAASTEVKRAGGGLMVSLVLDYTGSMWSNNNIYHLKTATTKLVDNLFGDKNMVDDLRVSLVPYAAAVNPGLPKIVETRTDDPGFDNVKGYVNRHDWKWAGCVLERTGDNALDDTPPSTEKWRPYLYPPASDNVYTWGDKLPDNANSIVPGGFINTNQMTGPNIGCPTPIVPLTKHRNDLDKAIDVATAWNRGGTLTDIGIAWGLRTMSPGEPFTESYDEIDKKSGKRLSESSRWRKAMVIMTDGDSTFFNFGGGGNANQEGTKPNGSHPSGSDYTGYGRLYRSTSVAAPAGYDLPYNAKPAGYDWNADAEYRNLLLFKDAPELSGVGATATIRKISYRIKQLCDRAKSEGVVVYTVVFTSSVGSEIRDLYRGCASDPGKYWYTTDGESLNIAFGAIGKDLNKLRIIR